MEDYKNKFLPQYLKQLARAIECPVIVISQLNRDIETHECKRPRCSDIKSNGSLFDYTDLLLFLYRDDYYDCDSEENDICEVIVAKNKSGTTGTARLSKVD